jgi:hypothetical protein
MIDQSNDALLAYLNADPVDAFAEFGGDELVRKLAHLMEAETSPQVFDQILRGLADALAAYAIGVWDLDQYRPEKTENAALERVARVAAELYEAMMTVTETGRSERKLAAAIDAFEKFPDGSSPAVLRGLVPAKRPLPTSMVSAMITDLSVAAEQAINRKPVQDPDFTGEEWDEWHEQSVQTWRERGSVMKSVYLFWPMRVSDMITH